ncbi:MAG: redoxin domain-containing protein [Acidobacteria bacterium]|nr:MAG: redoxin domain-containing protein [Acidobacteriota bacterium]
MKILCKSTLLLLLCVVPVAGAQTIVAVGDSAPDFTLEDSTGKTYTLSSYRGEKAVVLEFFRSGDW